MQIANGNNFMPHFLFSIQDSFKTLLNSTHSGLKQLSIRLSKTRIPHKRLFETLSYLLISHLIKFSRLVLYSSLNFTMPILKDLFKIQVQRIFEAHPHFLNVFNIYLYYSHLAQSILSLFQTCLSMLPATRDGLLILIFLSFFLCFSPIHYLRFTSGFQTPRAWPYM